MIRVLLIFTICINLISCSIKKTVSTNAYSVEYDSLFNTANLGIKLYDLDKNQDIYKLNSHKFFMPASNTKLMTMYAALKSFGDSIAGWSYAIDGDNLYIEPKGDPTFLNDKFSDQSFFRYLQSSDKNLIFVLPERVGVSRFGSGWSWGTWQEIYSPERNIMPIYGNMVTFKNNDGNIQATPSYFNSSIIQLNKDQQFDRFSVTRVEHKNEFLVRKSNSASISWRRPFTNVESDTLITYLLLCDTLTKSGFPNTIDYSNSKPDGLAFIDFNSINLDSLLSIMMKHSDNFFAEQILVMLSKHLLDKYDDTALRKHMQDSVMNSVFTEGKWVDGSGLSRGNLISPDEFVNLLTNIYFNDDVERVKQILPHGDEGTLKGLYKGYENNIWAKTGTLSDHLGLSGYLKTKSGKNIAFSILVNNFRGSATAYRKNIETYLINIINTY